MAFTEIDAKKIGPEGPTVTAFLPSYEILLPLQCAGPKNFWQQARIALILENSD